MFGRIQQGDKVIIKNSGMGARVLNVYYDKIFVETKSKRFGKTYQAWINKSEVRKV